MTRCPKCNSNSVSGRYCGKCGASTEADTSKKQEALLNQLPDLDIEETISEPSQTQNHSALIEELENKLKKDPANVNNYLELGKAQLAAGKLQQAFSTYRASKAIAPEEIELYRLGAKILTAQNKREEAISAYKKVLKARPDDMEAILCSSELLYDTGKKSEALSYLQKLKENATSNPEILIKIAQIHLSLGNPSQAQEELSQYRKLAGNNREMYLLMGKTMLTRQFYDGAIKNFSEAIRSFPKDPEMRLGLGKAYLGMNEKGKAILEFEQALNMSPNNQNILLELGKLQSNMGMTDQAEATFQKIEKSHNQNGEIFLELGKHFITSANFPKARYYLQKSIELSPYNQEILETMGSVLEKMKLFKEALELYTESVQNNNRLPWAHRGIIRTAEKCKDFESVAISLEALTKIEQPTADTWCDLGEALIKTGEFDKSQKAFEAAAKLDPTNTRAYQAPELIKIEKARSEGQKLATQGKEAMEKRFFLTASERLKKALELVPNEPEWLMLLAEVSLKTAEFDQASRLLSKLRSQDSENFWINFNLSRIYEIEGKAQLAIELLSNALKENPQEIQGHIELLKLKRTQIRGTRIEPEMIDALIKNLQFEFAHLRKESPSPLIVEAYANYIFGYRSKSQNERLAKAEALFREASARFGEKAEILNGLALIERAKGNTEQAINLTKEWIRVSTRPQQLHKLARLHENFQQYGEARKCYISLKNLFPEDGYFRKKVIEMSSHLSSIGSKNELVNSLSECQQSIQNKPDQMWVLYEMALIQQYLAESSTQKEEWIKKSLLNWNKAINHPDSNHWVRWGMMECQLKYQKDHDKKRAINQNLKACEKILREMPDSARANFYLGKCYLAFDDLANTQKALGLFDKANFLDPELTELHLVHAKACKNLGKSVLVDSIGYNMILLEPELAQTIFQL